MKGLDRQLEYARVACKAAEEFVRLLEPLFCEIAEGAEFDTRWEVAWGALKKLGGALSAADFALPRGFVRRPNPKRRSAAVAAWGVADKKGVLMETYAYAHDALEELTDYPGCRLVCLEESGRAPSEIDLSLHGVVSELERAKDSAADAWNRSQYLVEQAELQRDEAANALETFSNIVMAMGFDRERENEHARTHAECAFCREETRRDAASMLSHARVCGLHPMHELLSAATLVRNGDYGALPLAAMAKLNEALVAVGKAA